MMNKIDIQYQDIFLNWRHLMTKHHLPDAYRTATNRAKSTKRRHRLIDKNGNFDEDAFSDVKGFERFFFKL